MIILPSNRKMKFLVPVSLMLASIVRAQYPVPITFNGPAAANTHGDLAYQDISIVRRSSDGRYFRFSKSNHTGAGMSVATAPAFRGPWTYSYAAMTGALKACSSCKRDRLHLWAPEVHHVDGIYYLYYTINDPDHGNGLFDIAVSTSSNLEQGSWTDHGSVGIPSSSEKPDRLYVRLGVNLLANSSDPSGVDLDYKHLAFGSFNQGLFGSYLDQDLLTVASNNTVNEIIADQYNPNKDSKAAGNRTGGTYALHHGQYIYQFYSIGSCCGAVKKANQDALYRVEVCRGLYSDGPNGESVAKLLEFADKKSCRTILRSQRGKLLDRSCQSCWNCGYCQSWRQKGQIRGR